MSAPIRAFLVDDEPLALKRLARLLAATRRVEIVGQATDPARGLEEIAATTPDVVFLDIHMPGLSGLRVASELPPRVMVVFTTAYDQHAVAAFELNAVDYLLKPIERDRLGAALDRVASRRPDPERSELRTALDRLAGYLRGAPPLSHLASRIGERVQLIPIEEVTHVFARDRATYAATATSDYMLDVTIAELETRLDPDRFFRIHRSTLLNLAWVSELHADLGGRLVVRLRGGAMRHELVVSRDRARPLKERLGVL